MEFKNIISNNKAIEGRIVTGIAAVFGNVDSGNDLLHNGAFRKTLRENLSKGRIKFLWRHDGWEPPIAAIKSVKEVGVNGLPDIIKENYPEATGGLEVTREYLDTPRGNEILAGLKSDPPTITEMSFGYDAIKADEELINGKRIRHLREVKLWDVSDVNWGMNAATVAAKTFVPFRQALMETFMNFRDEKSLPEEVKALIDKLQSLLSKTTAEPLPEKDALTGIQATLTRLAIAERTLSMY